MGNHRPAAARSRRRRARAPRGWLSALLLTAASFAAAAAPARIASLNLCTDSMLFELVDDTRITSVTALSRDAGLSPFHARARQLPINHGAVEELLAGEPDLVLAGDDGSALATRLLDALGIPVLRFAHAASLAQYTANLRRLAHVLGAADRAEAIIARMQAALSALPTPPATPRAVVYQPNGYVPGVHTLMHEVLTRAGYFDVAADLELDFGGFIGLERLLLAAPAVLVLSRRELPAPSLAERMLEHPALRPSLGKLRRIGVDENLWTCASEFTVDAIVTLEHRHP